MEDDIKFLANGRQLKLFLNGRQLQILYRKYKNKNNINIRKSSLSYPQLELSLAQLSPSLFLINAAKKSHT